MRIEIATQNVYEPLDTIELTRRSRSTRRGNIELIQKDRFTFASSASFALRICLKSQKQLSVESLRILFVIILFLLSGCSLLGAAPSTRSYYVLTTPPLSNALASHEPGAPSVLVREATASGFINSQRILFSSDPIERRSYQYAYWTEPPPRTFTNLLLTTLDASGKFGSVASGTSSAIADFAVNPRLLSFYHDVTTPPGKIVVEVRVEIVAIRKAVVVANRTFRREVAAESFDAAGAVKAFSTGVAEMLTDIEGWVVTESRGHTE